MPRPCKQRRVRGKPNSHLFKPAGIPARKLETIEISREEFESIRLKDYEQLDQITCAQHMNISQPTFYRLLRKARHKIAQAIIQGKVIKII